MSVVADGLPPSVAAVGELTRLWKSYAPGKPVIPVLQAWAWDCLEDGEAAYPTYGGCRFMAYQAVINGAKGLHHYGAAEARRPNFACGIPPRLDADLDRAHEDFLTAQRHNRRFWGYYAKVVGEISRMGGVFASADAGWAPRLEAASAPGQEAAGVECLVKRHLDSDVILLANASDTRLTVRVGAPCLRNVLLNSWGRNGSVAAGPEGVFEDTLEPFGVRVYSDRPDLLEDSSNSITGGDDDGR